MAARAVAESWDQNRFTKPVRRRMRALIEATSEIEIRSDEVWAQEISPESWKEFRYADEASPSREVTDLVSREIENAIFWVVERGLSIDKNQLIRETAAIFGFSRAGSRIQDHFYDAIEALIAGGQVVEEDDRIKMPR